MSQQKSLGVWEWHICNSTLSFSLSTLFKACDLFWTASMYTRICFHNSRVNTNIKLSVNWYSHWAHVTRKLCMHTTETNNKLKKTNISKKRSDQNWKTETWMRLLCAMSHVVSDHTQSCSCPASWEPSLWCRHRYRWGGESLSAVTGSWKWPTASWKRTTQLTQTQSSAVYQL